MKILITLTYYRPHYSGLTLYVERLARSLVELGHQVTILTSRNEPQLPQYELKDGVEVHRLNVLMRISKGVIMPSFPLWAYKMAREADIVNLQVPQLDAAYIAVLSRLLNKPVVLTYHCDLRLPDGLVHSIANHVSHVANHISAQAANAIVTNTKDYAEHSPFLSRYMKKVCFIPPPVELPEITENDIKYFKQEVGIKPGQPIIAMVARLATEKGVEYLARALPEVIKKYPQARVLFVGKHLDVLGEESYAERLAPLFQQLGDHWKFLGILPTKKITALFHMADVLVLPSINPTESFGMVQVEAMACGTPVVATNLPGVRQPILTTGMGKIVPMRDVQSLAQAIISVLNNPEDYKGDIEAVANRYSSFTIGKEYEELFNKIISGG